MSDLDVLRARLQVVMVDLNAKSWSTDMLNESLRLALMDIGFVAGPELFIEGLDGQAATTLSAQDRGTLLIGASAYAALARALDTAEKNSAGPSAPASLKDYAKTQMDLFTKKLEQIRQRYFHTTTAAPHQSMIWTELPPNFEGWLEGQHSKPAATAPAGAPAGPIVPEEEIMEREARSVVATISSGAAVSTPVDSTWAAAQGLITPAALEATSKIGFKVCATSDGTFQPLYDEFNAIVEVPVTLNAARAYALPDKLFTWPYFKLWTQASGVDVNQTADRTFVVMQKS
jgi:hypothetical protein